MRAFVYEYVSVQTYDRVRLCVEPAVLIYGGLSFSGRCYSVMKPWLHRVVLVRLFSRFCAATGACQRHSVAQVMP